MQSGDAIFPNLRSYTYSFATFLLLYCFLNIHLGQLSKVCLSLILNWAVMSKCSTWLAENKFLSWVWWLGKLCLMYSSLDQSNPYFFFLKRNLNLIQRFLEWHISCDERKYLLILLGRLPLCLCFGIPYRFLCHARIWFTMYLFLAHSCIHIIASFICWNNIMCW